LSKFWRSLQIISGFRDLAISQIIVREMEAMGMQFPKPTVNLAEIRRKYREAATSGKANRHEKR